MGVLRFSWRVTTLLFWLLLGLCCVAAVLPFVSATRRQWIIQHWSIVLVRCCGVRVQVAGQPRLEGAVLFTANHISWLDIFILNSVRAISFVAKQEIRRWPVIGWLVAGAGTVFIDRTHRHAIRGVGEQIRLRFSAAEAVGLFPEGTTSEGLEVRPFHASLFEAAIRVGVDIQPVALRFYQAGQRSTRFAFVGDQSLVANIWVLLSSPSVQVRCEFLPVISAEACAELGRAGVAVVARRRVQGVVEGEQPVV